MVVAARVLGREEFGIYATALAAVGFFQVLLDLTVEESLTKYGFRYVAPGLGSAPPALPADAAYKLIGGALATCILLVLAPFADQLFGEDGVGAALPRPRCFRSSSRPRTSVQPHSSCTAGTTCAARTRRDPVRCA